MSKSKIYVLDCIQNTIVQDIIYRTIKNLCMEKRCSYKNKEHFIEETLDGDLYICLERTEGIGPHNKEAQNHRKKWWNMNGFESEAISDN